MAVLQPIIIMDVPATSLEFPISLEAVLSVSLDFDNLKVILEFLLGLIKGHDGLLRSLQSQFER